MNSTDKIKQNLTITIIDENGSRQITLAKSMQRFILWSAVALALLTIAGYFSLSYFVRKFSAMDIAKQESYREYQVVFEKNMFLQDDIRSKSEYLATMQERMKDLEQMVSQDPAVDSRLFSRADSKNFITHLEAEQKNTILQIIPNGSPLRSFEVKQRASAKSKEAYVLVNPALASSTYSATLNASVKNVGYDYYTSKSEPVYATADGIVESVRDNNQKYGYGNLVRLSHVLGFSTAYTNLAKVSVKQGDFVSRGDIIGYSRVSSLGGARTLADSKNHTDSKNPNGTAESKSLASAEVSLYYEVRFLSEGLDTLSFIDWSKQNFGSIFDSKNNGNINLQGFVWALNDIVKLNDISLHLSDSRDFDFIDSSVAGMKGFNLMKQEGLQSFTALKDIESEVGFKNSKIQNISKKYILKQNLAQQNLRLDSESVEF